jgi:hypothetical protein
MDNKIGKKIHPKSAQKKCQTNMSKILNLNGTNYQFVNSQNFKHKFYFKKDLHVPTNVTYGQN